MIEKISDFVLVSSLLIELDGILSSYYARRLVE